jgi:site-specific DNA recombinase
VFAEFGHLVPRAGAAGVGLIYARYSTDFQHSAADQVRACLEEAVRLRLHVPRDHVFIDLGVSGTKERRPGLDRVRDLLVRKGPKVLLVLTTNRLFRKMYKCMRFVEEQVVEKGHRAIFVRTHIDTAQGQQWRVPLQIHALTDELAGSMYAPNIRAALEGMFLKGWVVCSLPYGYHGVEVDGPLTKRLRPRRAVAIDPMEAEWVVRIFGWFVTDRLPMARILERLNELQAPLPPKSRSGYWTHGALRYLLENDCYRGWWEYGRGENVWVSEKDYVKRRLRAKPLKEKQFEDRRLVSDEVFYPAQKLLAESPQRAGRKPKNGDRVTRPRVLNGLLECKAHDRALKVCGNMGQWMCCPICRAMPKASRPIHTYLNRQLALRKVCEALAERIRTDQGLVTAIINACQDAAAAAGAVDPKRPTALRDRLDRLTRQINFVLQNAGDTDEDRRESADRVRTMRAERSEVAAELATLTAVAARPARVPTEAEARNLLAELAEVLLAAMGGADPADAGAVRTLLEMVTGGRIELEQAGERRKWHGWLVGRFVPRLLQTALSRLPGAPTGAGESSAELVIEFREDTIAILRAEQVKEMVDRGMLLTAIAEELKIDRHQVTAALRVWYEKRGLPAPPDGRVRRATVPKKNLAEPVFRLIAEEVKGLYDQGLLIEEIAERVGRTRATIRAALEYWFRSRGEPMPDGRNRRKSLSLKNRRRK